MTALEHLDDLHIVNTDADTTIRTSLNALEIIKRCKNDIYDLCWRYCQDTDELLILYEVLQ